LKTHAVLHKVSLFLSSALNFAKVTLSSSYEIISSKQHLKNGNYVGYTLTFSNLLQLRTFLSRIISSRLGPRNYLQEQHTLTVFKLNYSACFATRVLALFLRSTLWQYIQSAIKVDKKSFYARGRVTKIRMEISAAILLHESCI